MNMYHIQIMERTNVNAICNIYVIINYPKCNFGDGEMQLLKMSQVQSAETNATGQEDRRGVGRPVAGTCSGHATRAILFISQVLSAFGPHKIYFYNGTRYLQLGCMKLA